MRLYDSEGPSPKIVRIFMAEKGIAIERVPVDINAAENRGPAFVAKNPMGQLPALELDDGTILTEVVAICEYLEELHPEPPLIGATPQERAITRMWVRRFDLGILEPYLIGYRAAVARFYFEDRIPLLSEGAGTELLDHVARNLAHFDRLLAGRRYVCGERFSLADITLGMFLLFDRHMRAPLSPELTWIPGWLDRLEARGTFDA